MRRIKKQIERAVRSSRDLASLLRYDEVLKQKSTEPFLLQMRYTRK